MKYQEFVPTAFDRHIHVEDREDWLVAPVSQTRDSGPLDRSNFACALKKLGGESDSVEVHRFGHWGPGWFEIILAEPTEANAKLIYELEGALANYPILDESHFSELEWDEFRESWNSWGCRELKDTLKKRVGSLSEDLVDDIDSEVLFDWWINHADSAYEGNDSGVSIPIDHYAGRMTDSELARMLWDVKKGRVNA
jgi:hypothetical protein